MLNGLHLGDMCSISSIEQRPGPLLLLASLIAGCLESTKEESVVLIYRFFLLRLLKEQYK